MARLHTPILLTLAIVAGALGACDKNSGEAETREGFLPVFLTSAPSASAQTSAPSARQVLTALPAPASPPDPLLTARLSREEGAKAEATEAASVQAVRADNALVEKMAQDLAGDPLLLARQRDLCGPNNTKVLTRLQTEGYPERPESYAFRLACIATDRAESQRQVSGVKDTHAL
jgi:hypothetical protein